MQVTGITLRLFVKVPLRAAEGDFMPSLTFATLVAAIALVLATPAQAQQPIVPRPDDSMLENMLPPGHTFETRADGDLNGDGQIDVAFVGRGDDVRALYVALAYTDEFDLGHEIRAKGPLNAYPLGSAELSIARGVLVVEDLTGGTTATSATYRLRYEPKSKRIRLIGLDKTFYSRAYAHDGSESSWNLLTGAYIEHDLILTADGDQYEDGPERRKKWPSKPVYLENLPDVERWAS